MEQRTKPDQSTHAEEQVEAAHDHSADRPATGKESAVADEHFANSDEGERAEVAKHEEEMMVIGAEIKGEGAID
jgi:hypothetical protein